MSDPLNASAADALVSAAAVVVGGGGASLGDSVSARLLGYSPEQERSKKLGASGRCCRCGDKDPSDLVDKPSGLVTR